MVLMQPLCIFLGFPQSAEGNSPAKMLTQEICLSKLSVRLQNEGRRATLAT